MCGDGKQSFRERGYKPRLDGKPYDPANLDLYKMSAMHPDNIKKRQEK